MLLTRREIMSSWFKYGTRCVSVFVFFFFVAHLLWYFRLHHCFDETNMLFLSSS